MIVNFNCDRTYSVNVFLNGKHLKDCVQADEEKGEVWVAYRNSTGRFVSQYIAEPGSFICDGRQVILLRGKVEIKVQPQEGETEEDVRRIIRETYAPLLIERC